MFDWYALYALWFTCGIGQQELGYTSTKGGGEKAPELPATPKIMPLNREQAIRNAFEECTRQLAIRLVNALRWAVADEMWNVTDEYLIPPSEVALYAEREEGPFRKLLGSDGKPSVPDPQSFWNVFSYSDTVKIFQANFWSEYADAYGGTRWASIATALQDLHNALKRGNITGIIGLIDSIYDMEHNTGALTDKLPFDAKVSKPVLDVRFKLSSPEDYLPHVSPHVKGLIMSAKAYTALSS